ncbi:MAG: M15 family metallopeptidase [Clostridia bacterium]|nr:M15 family metallopeptidase [Clostridia bacterium]
MKKKNRSVPPLEEEGGEALSFEELALLRKEGAQHREEEAPAPYDTSDRAHLRRYMKRNPLLAGAVIVILTALVALLIFGVVMLINYLVNRPNTADFTFTLGEEKPYTVPYEDSVRDGVLYVDLRSLASFSDLTVSGSSARMQFTAHGNTYLRFEQKSEVAVINGDRVEMRVKEYRGEKTVPAKAYLTDTTCWVPYEFLVQTISEGLLFRLDSEKNTITVKRVYNVYNGDLENKEAADILFSSSSLTPLPSLTEQPEYEYSYAIDVSAYLDSITSEYLLLANKQNPLGATFSPTVVDLTCATDGERQRLQVDAANALSAMMLEMKQAGVDDIYVTSSYRSYSYQENLYNKYVSDHMTQDGMSREEAEAAASAYSARPGESEHQTGLCLDFTTDSIGGAVAEVFEDTEAFEWLSQNAYKFGFILRYPKDKVAITQYDYEPWHYRFVGREAATEIYFGSLCLEEYLSGTT